MVLSSIQDPYYKLMKAQKETWDSIDHPNVETVYYYGEELPEGVTPGDKRDLAMNCSDTYMMMHYKFKLALDAVWDREWDYIFKTNSSSYVDKHNLYLKAQTLDNKLVYCGVDGGRFASGAGAFISRDLCAYLRKVLNHIPQTYEDVHIGQLLNMEVTRGACRQDFDSLDNTILLDQYHYRCKIDSKDRNKDIEMFYKIFDKKR